LSCHARNLRLGSRPVNPLANAGRNRGGNKLKSFGTISLSRFARLAVCIAVVALVATCARTKHVDDTEASGAATHTKPDRILVYDFAASATDLPPDSELAKLYQSSGEPKSDEEVQLGRHLGELTAVYLTKALNKRDIPAINASTGALPKVGDGIIRGQFVTVEKGSRTTRMLVGFGFGKAELKTLVEAYQVTTDGLVTLGSTKVETAGGQLPGILVPVGAGVAAGALGAGVAASSTATSAAVSGASNAAQEFGPESVEAAAERTAEAIAKIVKEEWKKRGWL